MPDRVAQRFLADLDAATRKGRALEAMVGDIDGFTAAVRVAPDALGAAMAAAADAAGGAASVPREAFASAACTAGGTIVAADPAFAAWDIPAAELAKAVRQARADGAGGTPLPPRLSAIANDAVGRPVALAVALPDRARAWPLCVAVRTALVTGAAAYAVLGISSAEGLAWPRVFAAWGFSPAEARLARALLHSLDLRRAAQDVGVGYETARDTLASAMARTGARRQPEFVRQLALLALGDLPEHGATWQIFADAYGLSARQARLAQLIALGTTRTAAAAALGVSEHSAKADLKTVYERCGVEGQAGGAAALGRIVAEVDALARLAGATDVEILPPGALSAPLRFVRRRRAPGRIAVEDHGPASGVPVIVCHVPVNGRHLPRRLVAALQAEGLRPISVERPGFGLTSAAPGPAAGAAAGDVAAQAIADLIDVLDALEIARARLLGRSAWMPLAFAAAHPGRFDSGVLLSASPPDFRPQGGFYGALASVALDQPRLIDAMARMMVRLSSDRAIIRMTDKAIADCPSDVDAFADPVNRADFVRASRQSSVGDGFAREFALQARHTIPDAARTQRWTVVFGEHDPLGSGGAKGIAAWTVALPAARLEMIAGAGRFVHLSHPEHIAAALAAPW